MSKLKILLPTGKALTISNPFNKETKPLATLSLVINFLSLAVSSIFILLLPFAGNLMSSDQETSTLRYLLLFVALFLVIFLLKLAVQGNSFVVDPKGLLTILVFNLVLTSLSVLITTIKVSNTFGITGFRFLSGIALMSLIGLFYFTNLYARNSKGLRNLINLLTVGSIAFVIWTILTNDNQAHIVTNLPLITLSFALLAYRTFSSKSKILNSFLLGVYAIIVLIAVPFSKVTYSTLFYYSIVLFLSYFVVLSFYAIKSKKSLKYRLNQIKNNIQNFIKVKKGFTPTEKGLSDLNIVIFLITPVLILLSSIFLFANIPQTGKNTLVTEVVNQYTDAYRVITGGATTFNINNLRSLLLGVGSDNYNPAKPFLANVLLVNGLVGVLIYLSLWFYFAKNAKDIFVKKIKENSNYKLAGLLFFFSVLIPLTLITTYSNLLTIIILWLVYGLISVMFEQDHFDYLSNTITINNQTRTKKIIKLIAGAAVSIGIIYLLSLILGIVK